LRRAFSNILDNGLKYNVKGGRFRVQCYRVTDGVEVRCGNTGPGVPMAEQGKVFDQFYRAEKSRSTETGGFGLGLAMVKRIIQLHNGDVSFVSTLGVWTEVRLLIPVSKVIL
jgi:signal transduction histidine kinase